VLVTNLGKRVTIASDLYRFSSTRCSEIITPDTFLILCKIERLTDTEIDSVLGITSAI
jgi:hypothetical protein